jgi:SAM-dependent methyltransferase
MTAASAPNFDYIARPYRWLEYLTLGTALTRCRNTFLAQLGDRRHALVLGDGDGRFLARLLSANSRLYADAVDISPAMLRLLARRAHAAHPTAATRLRTFQTSALNFDAPSEIPYDLVVTHFFLDCFTRSELDLLVRRLRSHLAPGALWVLSDFRIPHGPLRWPARALIRSLYCAFRILTGLRTDRLPDYTATLTSAGFVRTARQLSFGGILGAELWVLSRSRPARETPNRRIFPNMQLPPQKHTPHVPDPVPDPEPASPSLPGPDPGVYHPDKPTPPKPR